MRTVLSRGRRFLPIAIVAVLIVAAFQVFSSGTKHGVAYFESVTSVYEGDKIRVLGIPVGQIDSIEPDQGKVRVEFSYDAQYDLPADVQAAIVSPTLVATRFIQLSPAYEGGPKFADGGTIPMERTASPLEFDDLKTELSRLSTALGPANDGTQGSLGRFLQVSAEAGEGQGQNFNTMIKNLSDALGTLSDGRGDIFGAVRNLEEFITAVAGLDSQVVDFNSRLADVSGLLADNDGDLTAAVASFDQAARDIDAFLAENRAELDDTMYQLGDVTSFLADDRDAIAQLLHVAPGTAMNLHHIFDWKTGSVVGGLMLDNLTAPGELACALISTQLAAGEAQQTTDTTCMDSLGPLLNLLSIQAPPIGLQLPINGGGLSSTPRNPVKSYGAPGEPSVIPNLGGTR